MRTRRISGYSRIGAEKLPYARYSHNLYPVCEYANRGPDGECFDRPVVSTGGGGNGASAKNGRMAARATIRRRLRSICARSGTSSWRRSTGALSPAQADELARRHGLERLASQNFPLLGGSTIGLFRIIDQRPVDMVRREFAADAAAA